MSEQTELHVALIQPRLAWKDPAENRQHLERAVRGLEQSPDLAVFPETFTTGFLGDPDLPEEGMDGATLAWMRALAAETGAALAGSAVITEQQHRYNRFLFVTPEGDCWHYDKRHLFGFAGENKRYSAGSERLIFEWRGWRINPQVCYDLRFPVWCRSRNDFDLQIFVANWPKPRVEHWMALLRARAIENQAAVIGVNRVGSDARGLEYPGRSQAYDALGTVLADLGGDENSEIVTLSLEAIRAVRQQFPFQQDADEFELRD